MEIKTTSTNNDNKNNNINMTEKDIEEQLNIDSDLDENMMTDVEIEYFKEYVNEFITYEYMNIVFDDIKSGKLSKHNTKKIDDDNMNLLETEIDYDNENDNDNLNEMSKKDIANETIKKMFAKKDDKYIDRRYLRKYIRSEN
jgi:hypothetical protein